MKKLTLLSAALALTSSMSAQAAIIGAVDLFDVSQEVIDTTTGPGGLSSDGAVSSSVVGPLTSILGGERDISVEIMKDTGYVGLVDGDPNDKSRVFVNGLGTMSFSNDNDIYGQATVQWDGADNSSVLNVTGLGGINLLATGADAFQFETIQTDLGFDISIELYTSLTQFTKAVIRTTGARIDTIMFADLQNAALCGLVTGLPSGLQSVTCGSGGTVDMSSLGAIQTVINIDGATASVDLKIGKIVTVPEPSIVGLLGAGLLAIGFTGARRRNSGLQA